MGKTTKEQRQDFIARLKLTGKYEAYKKKKTEQRRQQRMKVQERENAQQKKDRLEKLKKQVAESRKRKQEILTEQNDQQIHQQQDHQEQSQQQQSQPFANKQSFSKAYNKVKSALPSNRSKALAIIKKLNKEFDVTLHEEDVENISEIKNKVQNFFLNDVFSFPTAGMRDYFIQKNNDGSKIKIQKRYLTMTLKEAYGLFKQDFPNETISFSYFCSFRPKHVCLRENARANLALCLYHENINLLLQGTKNVIAKSIEDLIAKVICHGRKRYCFLQTCENCTNLKLFHDWISHHIRDEELQTEYTFKQWITANIKTVHRVAETKLLHEVLEILEKQLKYFLWHVYIQQAQKKTLSDRK